MNYKTKNKPLTLHDLRADSAGDEVGFWKRRPIIQGQRRVFTIVRVKPDLFYLADMTEKPCVLEKGDQQRIVDYYNNITKV